MGLSKFEKDADTINANVSSRWKVIDAPGDQSKNSTESVFSFKTEQFLSLSCATSPSKHSWYLMVFP